jgi:hypothetical protein
MSMSIKDALAGDCMASERLLTTNGHHIRRKEIRHGRKIELAKRLVHRSLKRKGANDFQSSSLSVFGSWATGAGKDELFELGDASRDA